jgi:hypothetical protein
MISAARMTNLAIPSREHAELGPSGNIELCSMTSGLRSGTFELKK